MNELPHCKLCNINFSSKSSFCNHNKKFHNMMGEKSTKNQLKSTYINQKSTFSQLDSSLVITTGYKCRFCNKLYNIVQSRWKHEKACKERAEKAQGAKEKEIELQLKKEEARIKRQEATILKLKLKLQNSNKVETVTLNKLNRLLSERHRTNNSMIQTNSNNNINNNTIHNNIQNNITNNIQIVGFGKEEGIPTLLTDREKHMILGFRLLSLQKLIEIVHCGKYNQFKNIIITNMKDNFMYKYDDTKGIFVLAPKDEMIDILINCRLDDLEIIYNEFVEQNKVDEKTKMRIEEFINRMNDGDDDYKKYQINEIKMLLFNNKDKIANDISLMLTVNEVNLCPV